ncbi:MAG TPA: hypothetical protein VNE00_13150 [Paraburkholderia sp.]|jgi:hypothetical protein|nr:hypothetical protein [Paraburkholderia sp.]
MKKTLAAVAFGTLSIASLAASATVEPTSPARAVGTPGHASQWKEPDDLTTMQTLVQNGYRLVSVAVYQSGPALNREFYLQRDQSVYRCTEETTAAARAALACVELAQPH